MYDAFDTDKDGKIDAKELKYMFISLGYNATDELVSQAVSIIFF